MRLRYVKNARELIETHPEHIIDNTENKKLDISDMFPNNNPLQIEIGMGKGQFIYALAKQNKDINYIGIEKYDSAIVKGLEKLMEEPLDNLYLLRADALDLMHLFDQNTVSRIYLNFSDPWPKDRHAKRRLTYKRFLKMYEELLLPNGEVHFKTDNIDLFNYSLESIGEYPMEIIYKTNDLHQENVENIMTEFEEKFSNKGFKINKLIARFKRRK